MKKLNFKRLLAMTLALVMALSLVACGGGSGGGSTGGTTGGTTGGGTTGGSTGGDNGGSAAPDKTYSLTMSGVTSSVYMLPVYAGVQNGAFEAAGLDLEYLIFDNGPVQMEALASNSWDIGVTGIGGVLSGLISYDALLVGANNSDNGTQTIWVRPDSDIAAAGSGHNTVSDKIVGDADSWKGKTILCNSGTVLEYLLIKTLGGFGLTTADVTIITMDSPTANSAFLAGEGDAAVLTGIVSFAPDKDNLVEVSCGNWADTGLMGNFIANRSSYEDPDTYEAMKIFMKVYYEQIQWLKDNAQEGYQMMSDFAAECGGSIDPATAEIFLSSDPFYSMDDVLKMMHTQADGQEYSVMEGYLLGVLDFFIDAGKYNAGDDQKFLGHLDTQLMDDVSAMMG